MDIRELKTKSIDELNHLLAESKTNLAELKFKAIQKQLKNIREIRIVKGDIARILTLLTGATSSANKDK